nr:MerR family DNA-binding transcriptional regulator [Lactobacillus apis]
MSKKFGLPKDTLRYWEKEGLIPAIKRDQMVIAFIVNTIKTRFFIF